ncbi:MAG: hypothetical protein OXL41_10590 [Nitrospinae bacterium]|nr:hypothetical protein [Nitrospinota bacterium]
MKDTKKITAMVTVSRESCSRENRYEFRKRLYLRRITYAGLSRAHRLEEEVDVHGGWTRAARDAHTGRLVEFQLPVGPHTDGTPTLVFDDHARIRIAGVGVPSQTEEST